MTPTLGSIHIANRKIEEAADFLTALRSRLLFQGDRWAVEEIDNALNKLKEVTDG